MRCLVWFGLEVTKISCRGHHCIFFGLAFSKRYHVGVNMHYLGCLQLRSNLEVMQISCSGHHDQRTPKSATEFTIVLSLAWRSQKGIICRGKYAFFGLVWFGGHQNQLQRSP